MSDVVTGSISTSSILQALRKGDMYGRRKGGVMKGKGKGSCVTKTVSKQPKGHKKSTKVKI